MTAQVTVQVVFPDGSSQTWTTGTAMIVADGVTPLSARMLGDHVGMLTAAGLLVPRDDQMTLFDACVPREVIEGALLNTTVFFEALRQRIVDNLG